jgi:hypothetical protein
MALADAIQGARRPSQQITWIDNDNVALDLTGATIAARIKNLTTAATVESDGVFTVESAAAGVFRWDYSTADVSEAGIFEIQFIATFGQSPTPAKTLKTSWYVHEAI